MRPLLIAHAVLQLGDALSTYFNITYLGFAEANPIMARAFDAGPQYFFLYKVIATVLVTAILWSRREYQSALNTAKVVVALMGAVVLWNISGAVLHVT